MIARLLAVLLFVSGSALADGKEQEALRAMNEGVALYRQDRLAEAHDLFVKARTLAPTRPNPYRWLAVTEQRQGDCPAALANVEAFLRLIPENDPRAVEAATIRDACKARVAPEASAAEPRYSPSPASSTTPIYRRWWLWTAVAAVAAVGLGVGLGVGLSSGDPAPPSAEGGTFPVRW